MQLSPHFSLAEFTLTQHRDIDNSLPPQLLPEAQKTAAMLERIREFLSVRAGRDIPILLSSGFRCLALNRAVKSADTSDHPRGMAADWSAPSFGAPYKVASALAPVVDELAIGQLIHEFGAWVHTSTRVPSKPANRVITINRAGTFVGVLP